MPIKIAFFDPYSPQNSQYDGKAKPPYRFLGMASQARARGAKTFIVEKGSGNIFQAIRAIEAFQPNVVGISTYFNDSCHRQALEVAAAFRGRAKIVVGGYDATTNPLVIEEFQPDYLVEGEGELPIEAMVEANFDPEKINPETARITKAGRTYIVEAQQAFDLNLLPLAHETMDSYNTRRKYQEVVINIARGCVGQCTFCPGGKQKVAYMSASKVIEHIRSWLPFIYPNSIIDLMAPDFTTSPNRANEIIRAINQQPDLQGKRYFFSVRGDTIAGALAKVFDDGTIALAEWENFLNHNRVEIEIGFETNDPQRLVKGHFNKINHPENNLGHLETLLQLAQKTGTKVGIDLISFDPLTSVEQVADDYALLNRLTEEYSDATYIFPDAIFRELKPYPGTLAVTIFGKNGFILTPHVKSIPLQPYEDHRSKALLDTLRGEADFFGIQPRLPLSTTLARIIALADFFCRSNANGQVDASFFVNHLRENPPQA